MWRFGSAWEGAKAWVYQGASDLHNRILYPETAVQGVEPMGPAAVQPMQVEINGKIEIVNAQGGGAKAVKQEPATGGKAATAKEAAAPAADYNADVQGFGGVASQPSPPVME